MGIIKSTLAKTLTETTKWFDIEGAEPLAQWDSPTAPGPDLTPCRVRVIWTSDDQRPRATVWGYRVKKDGTRSAMEPSEIHRLSRYSQVDWPAWLVNLVENHQP